MHTTGIGLAVACMLAGSAALSSGYVPPVGTRYLHAGPHGDAVMATGNAGGVVAITVHRPWGSRDARTRGAAQTGRTLDGWRRDDDTGLLYAGARYYDPRLGRFLGVDPAGQAVYMALRDAPVGFVDPDGRAFYRLFAADGRLAFHWDENANVFRRVTGATPVRVSRNMDAYEDDVFMRDLTDCYDHCGWARSIFDGWSRKILGDTDRRDSAIRGWLDTQQHLEASRKRNIRHSIVQWAQRNSQYSASRSEERAVLPSPSSSESPAHRRAGPVQPAVTETLPSNSTTMTAQGPPPLPGEQTVHGANTNPSPQRARNSDPRHAVGYLLNPLPEESQPTVPAEGTPAFLHPPIHRSLDLDMLRKLTPF